MVCLGLKPGAAGCYVQSNPLSYSGTPETLNFLKQRWVEVKFDQQTSEETLSHVKSK